MKILKIELENFMCYFGNDNVIEFNDGLNIILGGNGYGKTKLYDAFNWVLSDHITDQDGLLLINTKSIKEGLISRKALAQAVEGERITAKVSLEILNEKGVQIVLNRSYSVNKLSGVEFSSSGKSDFFINQKNEIEYKPIKLNDQAEIDEYIKENVIPLDILQHIWFQGERGIKNAIDTGNSQKLNQVINKLSYIDTWEKFILAADDTDRRSKEKFKSAARRTERHRDQAIAIQDEIEQIEKELSRLDKEYKINKEELIKVQDRVDDLSMGEGLREDLRKLKEDEVKLREELHFTRHQLDNMLNEANRELFSKFWVAFGTEHVANKFEELQGEYNYSQHEDRRRAKAGLPALPKGDISAIALKKMLDDEHCHICNRPAEEGSKAHEHIRSLLPQNYPKVEDNFQQYIHEGQIKSLTRSLHAITNVADSFKEKANSQKVLYIKLKNKLRQLEEEERDMEEQIAILLARYNLDSMDSGLKQGELFKELSLKLINLGKEVGVLDEQINQLSKKRDERNKELGELVNTDIDPILVKQKEYFEELLSAIKTAKDSQYKKLIKLLEFEANRHYEEINKEAGAFYGKLVFKQNTLGGYFPQIHNEYGEDVTSGMNTSQILSMQFSILFAILTANKEYGFNKRFPLIADAPNAAFDSKKKLSLLKQLGTTFDQSIVMLFEFLENDPNRPNRYKIDEGGISNLKQEMENSGVNTNVIMLDIPDDVSSKKINELTVKIKSL